MIAVDHRKTAGFYKLHSAEKSLRKARGVEVLGVAASYHEVDVSQTIVCQTLKPLGVKCY